MKTYLRMLDVDKTVDLTVPEASPSQAVASSDCPRCGASPLRVVGHGRRVAGFDRYEADGYCTACDAPVGLIVAEVDSLFGVEEDENVLELARRRGYKIY